MGKVFRIILCVFVVGCSTNNKRQADPAIYDEAALKNFVVSTQEVSEGNALYSLDSILNKASGDSDVFYKTVAYLETPLGDPNSDYRNEDLYSELLSAKIESSWYDDLSKEVARKKLHLMMQNKPGSLANDFMYTTPEGQKKKLYDIKAGYTLLMFYNPECPACKDMKASLIASKVINNEIASGKLKLLAIYTDEDESLWRKHLPEMPKEWIEGRDENEYLYNNSIYDLSAIPTLYLFDKNKKVLLKDCVDISKIENVIGGNQASP